MKRLLLTLALLFSTPLLAQNIPYSNIVLSGSGRPVGGAPVAVCSTGLATTSAQVISNIGVFTMSSNPITAGFAAGMTLQVQGFTGGDTYLNAGTITNSTIVGGYTILSVTSTTISISITAANATASSNGTLFQQGNVSTSCAPLAQIYNDQAGLSPIVQPGLLTDGIGNYAFYAQPGIYNVQYYGSAITTTVRPIAVASGTTAVTTSTFAGLPPAPATNALAIITDGTGLNCNSGGGATRELCQWNGSAWILISGGGGGSLTGMTPGQVPVAATTNTVTSSVAASTTVNGQSCALGSTCTVSSGSATAPFTSNSTPYASTGTLRLANNEAGDCWRNAANTGDICLTVNPSNLFTGPNGVVPVTQIASSGPSPNVDATLFGAQAVNINAVPQTTGTIGASSTALTVVSALGFGVNSAGVYPGLDVVNAGATNATTPPAAATVAPSIAATSTGTGSTARTYAIAAEAFGGGITAATTTTITNGNVTLGPNTTSITGIANLSANNWQMTVGSTANLAAGAWVKIAGVSDATEFAGRAHVTTVVDGTHFNFSNGMSIANGMSATSSTGGTLTYYLSDHITFPSLPAGTNMRNWLVWECDGNASACALPANAGSYRLVDSGYLANLGYSSDASYNTWDYYGTTMTQTAVPGAQADWFVPSTPPSTNTNDMLVSAISSISGNAVTLATASTNAATSQAVRFDNTPAFAATYTASNCGNVGCGGTPFIPAAPALGAGTLQCYVISSYYLFQGTWNQASPICNYAMMGWNGTWQGMNSSSIRNVQPGFSPQSLVPVYCRTSPCIWDRNSTIKGVSIIPTANGIGIFDTGNGPTILTDVNFSNGASATDFMGILYYLYNGSPGTGAFGGNWTNTSWSVGPAQVSGTTETPSLVTKNDSELTMNYYTQSLRGFYQECNPQVTACTFRDTFRQGEECQGCITPMFTLNNAISGNVGGSYHIEGLINDSGGDPIIVNGSLLGSTIGAPIYMSDFNFPGSSNPVISGNAFNGSIFATGVEGASAHQMGNNMVLIQCGQANQIIPGCVMPSINMHFASYAVSHTLNNLESAVVATATLTFTVDCTIKGQAWDVYSQTGTTTLAGSSGCTLYGNGATGPFTITNSTGVHVTVDNVGNAYAEGAGGGGGGGCAPGGSTDALQYNGGGTCSFGAVNSPTSPGIYLVNYNVPATSAVAPSITLPGIPVNAQSGTTYTIGAANYWNDRATLITATNSAAQTYTAVNPANTGFGFNMPYVLWNRGTASGALTENASGFTINGGASLLIPINWVAPHWSDGVNWFAVRYPEFAAFPNCTGGGNALQFTISTGTFACGSSSSGVSSFSGDGTFATNSSSTGGVTLALATAGAHKWWGNNTGSTTAAGYEALTGADMPAAVVQTGQTNVYGNFLQDFSGGTWKVPTGAGFTAGASSMLGYDSTNKNMHVYQNNADAFLCAFSSTPTTGDLVSVTVASSNILCSDAGFLATNAVRSTGSLTSTAIMTGAGSQASQTPNGSATLSSGGNMVLPGTLGVTGLITATGGCAGCLAPEALTSQNTYYATNYSGATVDVKVNACLTAAEATNGTCDATGLDGNQTIAAQINVGDGTHSIALLLPVQGQWNSTINDGTSCAFKQYGGTTMKSVNPGGASAMFVTNTGSTNPYALYCNVGAGVYLRLEGVKFRNTGHTAASGMDFLWTGTFDNSSATDVDVYDGIGTTYAAEVTLSCCTTSFWRFNVNGNSTAGVTPLYIHGTGSNYHNQQISFFSSSIDHPGATLPNIKIDGDSRTSVDFFGLYEEGNQASDTSTTWNQVDGVQSVRVYGATYDAQVAATTSAMWSISNTTNTHLDVHGSYVTGHDFSAFPLTAIINNNTTQCASTPCNIPTDVTGAFDYNNGGSVFAAMTATKLYATGIIDGKATMN